MPSAFREESQEDVLVSERTSKRAEFDYGGKELEDGPVSVRKQLAMVSDLPRNI